MKQNGLTLSEGNTIRESYLVFPRWTQPFWTWITGRSLPGERPTVVLNHWMYLALGLATFLFGILLGIVSVVWNCWLLLPLGWLITVGSTRTLISTIVHQCIHNRFDRNRNLTSFVAEALTIVTFTKSVRTYRTEHTHLHHRRGIFTTRRDPSAQFLLQCGFMPDSSAGMNTFRLILNSFSLMFHSRFLISRFKGNFVDVPWQRRLAAIFFWALVPFVSLSFGNLKIATVVFIMSYVVPVILLYHVSVLFEFISEHAWLVPSPRHKGLDKSPIPIRSWGRFCGSSVPARSGNVFLDLRRWVWWLIVTICYHIPVRVLVLPGDLPQHDFHHRCPGTIDWTHAAYARTETAAKMPDEFIEFWGLHRAIAHVFRNLENTCGQD